MKDRLLVLIAVPTIAVIAGTIASAQERSELDTLSFRPLSAAAAGAGTLPQADPDQGEPSEPPDGPELADVRTALDDIDAEIAANGEHSAGLVPLYTRLAAIYREIGEPADAIAALELAQDNVRRRRGLHSLDQAELIERMIAIRQASAPDGLAIELEADLRELVQRNPGHPRNPALLTAAADRQMAVANYLLINGLPPVININVNNAGLPGQFPYSRPRTALEVAGSMLRQARSSYRWAMQEAIAEGTSTLSGLFELEDKLLDSYYFELVHPELHGGGRYDRASAQLRYRGIAALDAKLRNVRSFRGTPQAVTNTLIEIADWHLMMGAFGYAMDRYQEAVDYLQAQEDSEGLVRTIFAPPSPVPLPAFVPADTAYARSGAVRGFIDVEIEISRFGRVRGVTVTGQSANATEAIERRLKRFVYQTRFRPRFVDGEWRRDDRFEIRYQFSYLDT